MIEDGVEMTESEKERYLERYVEEGSKSNEFWMWTRNKFKQHDAQMERIFSLVSGLHDDVERVETQYNFIQETLEG